MSQVSEIKRVNRSRDQAKSAYDKLSRSYDLLVGRWEKRPKEAGLRKLGVKDGERVLEIGFGTGQCLVPLSVSVGETGRVYGVDLSEGMLRRAESRLAEAGLSDRAELKLGDAIDLPFEDAFVDAVFISFALELFDTPEIPLVLEECRRVLKDDGRICVAAMSKEDQRDGFAVRLYEWAHDHFPSYVDCRPILPRQSLSSVGFAVLDSEDLSMWGLCAAIVVAGKRVRAPRS